MLVGENQEANYINGKLIDISGFAEKVLTCTPTLDGISYLKKNQANPASLPEIIFLDISTPDIHGFQFLDDFEKAPESVKDKCKIMILSNSLNAEEIDSILGKGPVAGYIAKPLLIEKLKMLKLRYLKSPKSKQKII